MVDLGATVFMVSKLQIWAPLFFPKFLNILDPKVPVGAAAEGLAWGGVAELGPWRLVQQRLARRLLAAPAVRSLLAAAAWHGLGVPCSAGQAARLRWPTRKILPSKAP